MPARFDVCILGDGIVGHVLALLLARDRLRVGLVGLARHRAKAHPDVRAYALNHTSRLLLEALRCWPDARHATPVLGMQVRESGGGMVEFSAAELREPALAWIVDVPGLEALLAEAVRFQPGIELLDAQQPADLTAICEGRDSDARQSLAIAWDADDYGQWALAGRVRCEQPHGQVARQWFGREAVLGMLPLSEPDGNSLAFVWSVPRERLDQPGMLGDAEFEEQLAIACGRYFGAMRLLTGRARWPLQLAAARQWVGAATDGSWALVGDAAHVVHPLAGQGLNLGLGDAAELARQIQSRQAWRGVGDLKLLRGYERARKAEVLLMGATTDGLQRLFSRTGAGWQGLRQWGMGGFERSGPIKRWVAGRAMGSARRPMP